ncbi:N-acetylglucosamine kinase [Pseudarthrobacter sp. N5]|uniref:N-acetylglucosamine kinase n=1 Tax=Pseudarthrobacter sp. N5 TaxID=3418416 RepID=UPI003CF9518A
MTLGIDIGGSKTHAQLALGGEAVAEAVAASANIASVGAVQARLNLDDLAGRLRSQLRGMALEPDRVVAGAAGADTAKDCLALEQLLQDLWPSASISVTHDTEIILAAAGLATGIVVISGTGTAAFAATPDGARYRAGGWGYILGDEGSGYGIVRAGVRHALELADAGFPDDPLTRDLLQATGAATAHDLMSLFYQVPERRIWARRSELVFTLAAAGNPASMRIIDEAAESLCSLVQTVSARAGLNGPVVFAGGIAQNQPGFMACVAAALARKGHNDVRILDRSPAHGALILAGADPFTGSRDSSASLLLSRT